MSTDAEFISASVDYKYIWERWGMTSFMVLKNK
jgi:hypothetical protein